MFRAIRPLALLSLVLLSACAVPPVQPSAVQVLVDTPLMLACEGDARGLDAQASSLRVLVFRAGAAARLGHNHVLTVAGLQGSACLPVDLKAGLAGTQFSLAFRLDQMDLDEPAQRAALGPGWASVLTPQDVAATREHMLGAQGLQAADHPWVRIRSLQVQGYAPALVAEVEIELHGQRRRQWIALKLEPFGTEWRASGALVIRQSDFGVTPYSVLGGLLAVRDELEVDFALQTRRP